MESLAFLLNMAMSIAMSILAYYITYHTIPKMSSMFVDAHLFGIDLCKNKKMAKKIPESLGVIAGCVYLVILFCFIPIQFSQYKSSENVDLFSSDSNLISRYLFVQFLAGLLSICCMLFLGFADDVLNLRWRVKLLLPTLASLPLLIVYALTYDNTTIIVPKPVRPLLGFSIDLGMFYYLYLSMLAVFCTNAINILAGINGLEAGQSLVISLSIIAHNIAELYRSPDQWHSHVFSLNMMLPFLAVTYGLLRHNWYPAKVFVGDTYCYFAGMTFAVVGILGHFSKTMLLFFLPQIFNFLYSCPQLFHFVPCPRHRLPRYNMEDDLIHPSIFLLNIQETSPLGVLMIKVLNKLRLIQMKRLPNVEETYECSNMTLINLMIVKFGPMKEETLTYLLLTIQIICTFIAFLIRYGLSEIFY